MYTRYTGPLAYGSEVIALNHGLGLSGGCVGAALPEFQSFGLPVGERQMGLVQNLQLVEERQRVAGLGGEGDGEGGAIRGNTYISPGFGGAS